MIPKALRRKIFRRFTDWWNQQKSTFCQLLSQKHLKLQNHKKIFVILEFQKVLTLMRSLEIRSIQCTKKIYQCSSIRLKRIDKKDNKKAKAHWKKSQSSLRIFQPINTKHRARKSHHSSKGKSTRKRFSLFWWKKRKGKNFWTNPVFSMGSMKVLLRTWNMRLTTVRRVSEQLINWCDEG